MIPHWLARMIVVAAWAHVFGRTPTPAEARAAHALGMVETGCGTTLGGWNWGGVTAEPTWPGASFAHRDHDAAGRVYWTRFRAYADTLAGAEDMIRVAFAAPLTRASVRWPSNLAAALYTHGYYSGIGATATERQRYYAARLGAAYAIIDREIVSRPARGE